MKNRFVITCIIVITILLGIIIIFKKDEQSYLIDTTYSEVKEKINNKESFILYIHQTTCGACQAFLPRLNKVINSNKINVYALNLSNLEENDYIDFDNTISIVGTPTIIFYENGIELDESTRIVGAKQETIIINKFKNMGYIK